MNWIFDTYSNVYSAAMMQPHDKAVNAAHANNSTKTESTVRLGLFRRLDRAGVFVSLDGRSELIDGADPAREISANMVTASGISASP